MLVHFDRATSAVELKEALETGSAEEKADAMKKVISLLLSGESMPQVFITIVRYVLPSEDHTVQKLLLLYMETIDAELASIERIQALKSQVLALFGSLLLSVFVGVANLVSNVVFKHYFGGNSG